MNKKLFVVSILLVGILFQACQNEKNKEIFDEFEGQEGFSMIKLPPRLFLGLVEGETGTSTDNLGSVDLVKLMIFDESASDKRSSRELAEELSAKFDKYGYELAIDFASGGTAISAYVLENEEYVSDLMIIINEKESLIGLGLSGKLDSQSLMKFASEIDYDDLKDLSSLGLDFNF